MFKLFYRDADIMREKQKLAQDKPVAKKWGESSFYMLLRLDSPFLSLLTATNYFMSIALGEGGLYICNK